MPDRVPPHDLDAEAAVIGTMFLTAAARDTASAQLRPRDFYKPANALAFEAICALHDDGDGVTPVSVAAWLGEHGDPALNPTRQELLAKSGASPNSMAIGTHVRIVRGHAAKRRAIEEASRLTEAAYDPSSTPGEVAEVAAAVGNAVALPVGDVEAGPGIHSWLGEADVAPDWVIPGFLERGEEVALTGWMEGGGKTTMLRQLAVQCAAGVVPFTSEGRCTPARVLMVDGENRESQSKRRFRPLAITAGDDLDDESRLVVKCRPEGLDLLGQRDQEWLIAHIEANRPDLLMLGPLYKLHEDDPTAEQPARRLAAFLDKIVVRYGLALIVEAHPPNEAQGFKRPLRIYGASLWRRWFETGLGITQGEDKTYELVQWRVTRGDGDWPEVLVRGGIWPWGRGHKLSATA